MTRSVPILSSHLHLEVSRGLFSVGLPVEFLKAFLRKINGTRIRTTKAFVSESREIYRQFFKRKAYKSWDINH